MPTRLLPLAIALSVSFVDSTFAQTRRPGDTTLVPWHELTGRPRFQISVRAAGIQFPSMMRDAGVGGDVQMRLIVGEDGAPELGSMRVDTSTHAMFTSMIKRALPQWKFTPPMLNGTPVRAAVSVHVSFRTPLDREVPSREISTVASDSTGIQIVLGWEVVPPTIGLVADRLDSMNVIERVLSELLLTTQPPRGGAICVAGDESRANLSTDVFERLRLARPTLRSSDRCPPTFASMILQLDSLGKPARPPTTPDPVWVFLSRVRPWTADLYVMRGFVAQGTGGIMYHCEARRTGREAAWTAACSHVATFVS